MNKKAPASRCLMNSIGTQEFYAIESPKGIILYGTISTSPTDSISKFVSIAGALKRKPYFWRKMRKTGYKTVVLGKIRSLQPH